MQRVPLPDDQWADVRSIPEITVKGRGAIARSGSSQVDGMVKMFRLAELDNDREAAYQSGDPEAVLAVAEQIQQSSLTDEEMEAAQVYEWTCVATFVHAWSFPEPVSLEAVMELPIGTYDVIQAVVGPLVMEMVGLIPHVTPDDVMDPASPTVPSSGSNTDWRDEKSPSTTTPESVKLIEALTGTGGNSSTDEPSAG